jgi:hypothetical protein
MGGSQSVAGLPWTTYRRNGTFASIFLSMPSQAFEARFVAYLHVASLTVSCRDYQTLRP